MLTPVVDDDGAPSGSTPPRASCESRPAHRLRRTPLPAPALLPPLPVLRQRVAQDERQGRVWSYVVPHPPLLPAYAARAPYNVIVVELAEAPRIRLVGNLVSGPDAPLNSVARERIRIGARVQVVFARRGRHRAAALGPGAAMTAAHHHRQGHGRRGRDP